MSSDNAFTWMLFGDFITQWERGGMSGDTTALNFVPHILLLVFGYGIRGQELIDIVNRLRQIEAHFLAIRAADMERKKK